MSIGRRLFNCGSRCVAGHGCGWATRGPVLKLGGAAPLGQAPPAGLPDAIVDDVGGPNPVVEPGGGAVGFAGKLADGFVVAGEADGSGAPPFGHAPLPAVPEFVFGENDEPLDGGAVMDDG